MTKLLLDSVDAYLVSMKSLINKSKRCMYPVVRERQVLADALSRYLSMIGLDRREKPIVSLGDYLGNNEVEDVPNPASKKGAK